MSRSVALEEEGVSSESRRDEDLARVWWPVVLWGEGEGERERDRDCGVGGGGGVGRGGGNSEAERER